MESKPSREHLQHVHCDVLVCLLGGAWTSAHSFLVYASLHQWPCTTKGSQWSLSTRDKLGTGPLSLIQWSIFTRDKLGMGGSFVPYTVEPLYKGQVGDGSFVPYTVEHLYKGQVGDGSFVPYTVEPLYKGQVGDGGSFVPYTVEPLYKGQVGDGGSFVPYTVEPLYKGQVGGGSNVLCRVEPLYKGQVGGGCFISNISIMDKMVVGYGTQSCSVILDN